VSSVAPKVRACVSEVSHSANVASTHPDVAAWRRLPGVYPAELECDVVVTTGESFHLRPIRADDAQGLDAFHQRLTRDSIYRRYFSLHPVLSDAEVAHLTQVDFTDRLAFVVEDGDLLIAVGRYDRFPSSNSAEVAFVVSDDYQHRGIGLSLLEKLADAAWPMGITTFIAETQADNRYMMSVFQDSGFEVHAHMEDEVISVRFNIEPTAQSSARRTSRRARFNEGDTSSTGLQ